MRCRNIVAHKCSGIRMKLHCSTYEPVHERASAARFVCRILFLPKCSLASRYFDP